MGNDAMTIGSSTSSSSGIGSGYSFDMFSGNKEEGNKTAYMGPDIGYLLKKGIVRPQATASAFTA